MSVHQHSLEPSAPGPAEDDNIPGKSGNRLPRLVDAELVRRCAKMLQQDHIAATTQVLCAFLKGYMKIS